MDKIKYAIAPIRAMDGKKEYITEGKKYLVSNMDDDTYNRGFNITDNTGEVRYCLENGCAHLMGDNWEII